MNVNQNKNSQLFLIFAAFYNENYYVMEEWELDFEWLRIRHLVKKQFQRDKLPDLNAILLLIGVQELGTIATAFTKEEKQDLMHVAVCQLLSQIGHYDFVGRDADGWPHYELKNPVKEEGPDKQAVLLKTQIIQYFKKWADSQAA